MTKKFIVKGRVQGVGYRYFTQNEAKKLNVLGTVKNLYNGDVEIIAQADKEILSLFQDRLKNGPSFGRVDHIFVEETEDELKYTDFRIVY